MEETKRRRYIIRAVLEGEVDIQDAPQPLSPYTFVEYIESTGNEYLDMGIAADSIDTVEIDVYTLPTTIGWRWLYGAAANLSSPNSPVDARGAVRAGSPYARFYAGATQLIINNVYPESARYTIKHYADAANEIAYKDGSQIGTRSDDFQYSSNSMYLFSANNNGSRLTPYVGRIYSAKVYNGETLVVDLKPAIRNEDEAVGMYDEVRDIFLENQGSGAFTAGPEI